MSMFELASFNFIRVFPTLCPSTQDGSDWTAPLVRQPGARVLSAGNFSTRRRRNNRCWLPSVSRWKGGAPVGESGKAD